MRGGDQFFGVGAGFILETGGEAVGLIGERARPRREVTLAVLAETLVTRRGATRYRHFASPLSIVWPQHAPEPAPSTVTSNPDTNRKSVGKGKRGQVEENYGGARKIKKKKKETQ